MLKISRNILCEYNKRCSAPHQESSKIGFAIFQFSYKFLGIFQVSAITLFLLKFPFCTEDPTRTETSQLRPWFTENTLGRLGPLQSHPWPWGRRGWPESGETGGAPGRGRGRARPRPHLGSGGGRSWGGGVVVVGARRGPVAAATVGGVAGERGFRLAHKQRLWLTCKLEEVLGVSAGDETLEKNGSSLKRWSRRRLWQWSCVRGWNTALNRGTRPTMMTA
jgi:hypothetical protein